MTWILIFWLATPDNHTRYLQYQQQHECQQAADVWNQRFMQVQSKLVAKCVPST